MNKPAVTRKKTYTRFDLLQRIEHGVFLVSFSLLGLTGLPQKYAAAGISVAFFDLIGGIEMARIIHHNSAIVMMVVSIIHVLELIYRVFVLRSPITMIPWIDDLRHVYHDVLYYLGLRKHQGYYGRYSYAEKAEYLALIWGTVVMGLTGFMMWNPISTVRFLPGEAIPAAKAAHGGEAVLAVLAIIIWHFYHVHIKMFNKSMFTGRMTRKEMKHEHPAELAEIEQGKGKPAIPPAVLRKRQMVFVPVALAILAVYGYGFYFFVGYETTAAIASPFGETAEVFAPLSPTLALIVPTPTPPPPPGPVTPPPGPFTWQDDIAPMLAASCTPCHDAGAFTGLYFDTYANFMAGGPNGPLVSPGNGSGSIVVAMMLAGEHPALLSGMDLAILTAWIDAGAYETGQAPPTATPEPTATPTTTLLPTTEAGLSATPQASPTPAALTWESGIASMLSGRCGTCHGANSSTGLSFDTYANFMAGGKNGTIVIAGDSTGSIIVIQQSSGDHPVLLTPEELAALILWIDAGVPER